MRPATIPAILSFFLATSAALAEHAKVTLDVESGSKKETAFVDQTPLTAQSPPRPGAGLGLPNITDQ